jgi:hypothetical protein
VSARANERYALVITGAPGGEEYRARYQAWERDMTGALVDRLGFARDHVELLSGATDDPERSSTRAHVQRDVDRLKSRAHADDIIFIVLMGHGSADGGVAKFNLPGPDLTSAEWGSLLRDMPGRVVVVNTSGASFPFMADLATRGHIVITATDSAAQRYDTVFPAQLLAALNDPPIWTRTAACLCGSCSCTPPGAWPGTMSRRACWRPNARCSTTAAMASVSRPATTPARTARSRGPRISNAKRWK